MVLEANRRAISEAISTGEMGDMSEDLGHGHSWPRHRAGFDWKCERPDTHAVAQPGKELLFVPLNQYRGATDTKQRHDRFVRLEVAMEPISPFWNSRKAVNLRQ